MLPQCSAKIRASDKDLPMINVISSNEMRTCFITYHFLTNFRCTSNPKRCSIVLNVHLSQNTSTIWSITYGIISVQNHSNVQIAATHASTSRCSILIWNPIQMFINIGKKKKHYIYLLTISICLPSNQIESRQQLAFQPPFWKKKLRKLQIRPSAVGMASNFGHRSRSRRS